MDIRLGVDSGCRQILIVLSALPGNTSHPHQTYATATLLTSRNVGNGAKLLSFAPIGAGLADTLQKMPLFVIWSLMIGFQSTDLIIKIQWRSLAAMTSLMLGWSSAVHAYTQLPDRWRKTMASDPGSNYWLRKFSEPVSDRMVSVVRSIMLFRLLSTGCKGVSSDRSIFDAYGRAPGFLLLSHEAAKEASMRGAALFGGFDYEALAHLCAGSDYFFGDKGVFGQKRNNQRVWKFGDPIQSRP